MVFENFSKTNNHTYDSAIEALSIIDSISRFCAVFAHLIYFAVVILYKEMHKKGLIYLHHTNLISLAYCTMFLFYLVDLHPSFLDESLNNALCELSEIVWANIKYLQSYSILLLSGYRFLACNLMSIFRKLNKSSIALILPIVSIWIVSISLVIGTKFGLDTTYGRIYCIDGYSENNSSEINYFIVATIFSFCIPFVFNSVFFICIYRKMTKYETDHNHIHSFQSKNSKVSDHHDHDHFHHNSAQTHQLFLINICYDFSFIVSLFLDLRYILDLSSGYLLIIRLVLRILSLLSHLAMPLISLLYSPFILKKINRKLKKNRIIHTTHISTSMKN